MFLALFLQYSATENEESEIPKMIFEPQGVVLNLWKGDAKLKIFIVKSALQRCFLVIRV